MKEERITDLNYVNTYYIPNTNIRVEEHNPAELKKLWENIDSLNSF